MMVHFIQNRTSTFPVNSCQKTHETFLSDIYSVFLSVKIYCKSEKEIRMRKLKDVLAVLLASLSLHIYPSEIDSLLRELDMSIRNRPQYTLKRQEQIDALQRKLRLSHSDQERYDLYRELFGKYRSYRMDSALWVANQRVELAKRMKNPLYIRSAELNIAEVMIGVAMYKEGLEILDGIKSADLDASGVSYYYYQYHQVYTLMADYAFSDQMKEHYRGLAYQYKDSITVCAVPVHRVIC